MQKTCNVRLLARDGVTTRLEHVVSVNLQDEHYAVIECLNDSQYIVNHNNVVEIEIHQNT